MNGPNANLEAMSRREKLLESIKSGPNNVTFAQIRKLFELSGSSLERVGESLHLSEERDDLTDAGTQRSRKECLRQTRARVSR